MTDERDQDKILADAAEELEAKFESMRKVYGDKAAYLGTHLAQSAMYYSRINNVARSPEAMARWKHAMRNHEANFVSTLCELFGIDMKDVNAVSEGVFEHQKLVCDDLKESVGADKVFLIGVVNMKGTEDGKG